MKSKEQLKEEIDHLCDQIKLPGVDPWLVFSDIFKLKSDLMYFDSADPIKSEAKKEWPQVGDIYFTINTSSKIKYCEWSGAWWEREIKEFHNIFKTAEEAAKELSCLQFERAVRAKAKELNNGWVADWTKSFSSEKYQIVYESSHILINYWYESNYSLIRGSECKDYETAEKLLGHFGKDKFYAYATGGDL